MALQVRAASRTDVGLARDGNEDACFVGRHVFAVADGLGGHQAGEVASNLALEPIVELDRLDAARAAEQLVGAVRRGNTVVFDRAQKNASLKGMGTTMTVLVVSADRAHLAHVGDSRCYLIRSARIHRISRDHTLVARMVSEGRLTAEQAEAHPQRSILTRALGSEREVDVDEATFDLHPGDRIVLCSDGLSAVLSDDEILAVAAGVPAGRALQPICDALIEEANARGGPDNVTAVVVEVDGSPSRSRSSTLLPAPYGRTEQPAYRPVSRRRIPVRPIVWVLAVLAVVVAGVALLRAWTSNSYYVGLHEEQVAIYRGVPVEVLGARLSSLEELTPLRVADVAEWYQDNLEQGVRAESLEDARRIVAEQVPRAPRAGPAARPSPTATGQATP